MRINIVSLYLICALGIITTTLTVIEQVTQIQQANTEVRNLSSQLVSIDVNQPTVTPKDQLATSDNTVLASLTTEPILTPTVTPPLPTNKPAATQKPTPTTAPAIPISSVSDGINKARQANNTNLVATSDVTCTVADERLQAVAQNLSHNGLATYMSKYGLAFGEVIATGYTDPTTIINAWLNSPAHRPIVLGSSWRFACVRSSGTLTIAIFSN